MERQPDFTDADLVALKIRLSDSNYKSTEADWAIAEWENNRDAQLILDTGSGLYGKTMERTVQSAQTSILEEIQESAFRVLDHHLNTSRLARDEDPSAVRHLHVKALEEACRLIAEQLETLPKALDVHEGHIQSTTYWGAARSLLRSQRKMTDASDD